MSALPHEPPDISSTEERLIDLIGLEGERTLGPVQKVSVSLPQGLTDAIRHRVGRGHFSQYVTAAVAKQFEMDLLKELLDILEEEHGPIPPEIQAEVDAEWRRA